MGKSRWERGGGPASLETMPDPVNQIAAAAVDDGGRPRRKRPAALLPWQPRCLGCRDAVAGALDLCDDCRRRLPWNDHACPRCALPLSTEFPVAPCPACRRRPPPVVATVAPLLYAPPIDRWQPRFKFHQDLAAGRLLACLLAEACAASARPDAVVPVPLHHGRLRARGYDQALELARVVARTLALPLHAGLLLRRRATAPQSELDAAARQANLRGAFGVRPGAEPPVHVALVDDVMTTGATLHAAAVALREAGAGRVDAWVCARVP
jgi:ComF family protein